MEQGKILYRLGELTVDVRKMEPDDIYAAAGIVGMNYGREYEMLATKELGGMFAEVAIKPKYYIVARGQEYFGFGGYIQSWMDYGVYEIFWVNVAPSWQRLGIGKMIVDTLLTNICYDSEGKAMLVQLTADSKADLPNYYSRHWGFRTIQQFGGLYHLMALEHPCNEFSPNGKINDA